MIRADLISRRSNIKTKERCHIYVNGQTRQMGKILKLATRLNEIEVFNASLKIAGVFSRSLSKEDWKKIADTNDPYEVGLILSDRIKTSDLEKLRIEKPKAPATSSIKKEYELKSIDEGLKGLSEAHSRREAPPIMPR